MTGRVLLPAVLGVALIAALSIIMFDDHRGGVTETVAVVDEEGRTIERVVPKSEFRKSLAVYLFDNKSNDPENDWLGAAVCFLLEMDLDQDQFLTVRSAFDPYAFQQLQRAGFKSWEEAPWTIKREFASKSNLDYLVTGSVFMEQRDYVVTKVVHEVSTGKQVAKQSYRGRNLFGLADSITLDLRADLKIPAGDAKSVTDLPVAEMTTSSPEALKTMVLAMEKAIFDRDFPGSIAFFEKAVQIDSTAAVAYYGLSGLYPFVNQGEKVEATLERLMRHRYKLPERLQFLVGASYYSWRKEPDKEVAVLRMMIELYPEDIESREMLAATLNSQNRLDEAIELFEEILGIAPDRTEYLQSIGELYLKKGDFAQALEHYEAYAKRHPTNVNSFTKIATVYEEQGDYERAMQNYDKALLLEPENVLVLRAEAIIDSRMGRWDEALKKYNATLALTRTPADRIAVYTAIQWLYVRRGELGKSFEPMRLKWAESEKSRPAFNLVFMKLEDAKLLIRADRRTEAFEIIDSAKKQIGYPFDGLVELGYVRAYVELEEADSAQAALERFIPFIETYKLEILRAIIYDARGRIEEIRGDFREAIRNYEQKVAMDPTDAFMYSRIGRCQRRLGEYKNAQASLMKTLKKYPSDGETLYELALLQADTGQKDKAVGTLKKALAVWENADPVYKPAREARDKLAEWTSETS